MNPCETRQMSVPAENSIIAARKIWRGESLQEEPGRRDDDGHGEHEGAGQPLAEFRWDAECLVEFGDGDGHRRLVEDAHEGATSKPDDLSQRADGLRWGVCAGAGDMLDKTVLRSDVSWGPGWAEVARRCRIDAQTNVLTATQTNVFPFLADSGENPNSRRPSSLRARSRQHASKRTNAGGDEIAVAEDHQRWAIGGRRRRSRARLDEGVGIFDGGTVAVDGGEGSHSSKATHSRSRRSRS